MLPNRAHGNIHYPTAGLAPSKAFKTTKKTVETGSQNIHLPERSLRKLSRRASLKRNCCQTRLDFLGQPRQHRNTVAGPNNRSGPHYGSLYPFSPSDSVKENSVKFCCLPTASCASVVYLLIFFISALVPLKSHMKKSVG